MMRNKEKLVEELISKALNIKDYIEIIMTVDKKNIATDEKFQKTFNHFFRVRSSKDSWQKTYYEYFEENKLRKDITFKEILYYLYDQTGQIEHSFSSKMLATINPDLPIWDKFISNYFDLKIGGRTKKEELKNRVILYEELINRYNDLLNSNIGKSYIEDFDCLMPSYKHKLTPLKKIDYIIWAIRSDSSETKKD